MTMEEPERVGLEAFDNVRGETECHSFPNDPDPDKLSVLGQDPLIPPALLQSELPSVGDVQDLELNTC